MSADLLQPVSEPGLASLSEREHEVFLLLARSSAPKQVAAQLDISVKTAYLHRATVRA